jgi:NhaA family Na+:H+ antiporter
MPIFALANTNIRFEDKMIDGLYSPLGLGILLGLFVGKPIGVFTFSWLSVKLGLASLPSRANWKHIIGLGFLAGIGFTMSIFVTMLSLDKPEFQIEAKFSILVASVLSGITGYIFLNLLHSKKIKKI